MRQLFALIKKEFIQIRRDPRTLGIILFAPLVMLLLYGFAINFDLHHIRVMVCDQDKTRASREFIRGFSSSDYFDIAGTTDLPQRLTDHLDTGSVRAVLWIPPGFERNLAKQRPADIFLGLDGADSNTATIALGYFTAYVRSYSSGIVARRLERSGRERMNALLVPFTTEERVWYNEELQSSHFIVPGLIAILLMMMVAVLTSMAVTGEKERNTFEQLAASPMYSWQLILGKIVPYSLVSFLGVLLIIPAGIFIFGVPFRGSLPLLLLFILLFLTTVLGIGLFISTVAKTQQQALLMAVSTTMLPAILLSGFVFPLESMPWLLRVISYAIPARYFLVALRGIFLKGIGLDILWPQAEALLFFASVLVTAASLRFKKRLD